VVAQIVMDWLGIQPPVQDVTRIIALSSGWTTRLYLALLAVVIAPVVEEMLFRGILLPALARRVGVKPAIVVVSLLFALVHGHLPSLIPLFMLSVILSLLYLHRGTLVAPVAMHSLFNSLTVAVLFLP
jgi:membrane protease YdiL (CAAX protease family)